MGDGMNGIGTGIGMPAMPGMAMPAIPAAPPALCIAAACMYICHEYAAIICERSATSHCQYSPAQPAIKSNQLREDKQEGGGGGIGSDHGMALVNHTGCAVKERVHCMLMAF